MSKAQLFHFDDGTTAKFWSICVSGKQHVVRFGKQGTRGQQRVKSFASAKDARADADRLITQKTRKGYGPPPQRGPVKNPKIPQAIKFRTKTSLQDEFSVPAAWDRLEEWLKEFLPDTFRSLKPPAKAKEIRAFERTVGHKLPESVVESYRRHNGDEHSGTGPFFGLPYLDLDAALHEWTTWSSYEDNKDDYDFDDSTSCFPVEYVRPVYATRGWIPISDDSGGNNLAIDMTPGPQGTVGQVIVFGRDDEFHPVLALSWGQFLTDVADELERGNWKILFDEDDDSYEFRVGVPNTAHFHSAGGNWSRHKLGLRTLNAKNKAVWTPNSLK